MTDTANAAPKIELEDMVLPVYEFYVEGLTPLVMNSPQGMRGPDDSLGRKKIPSPEDEAASKAYRTADGELYLPSRAFRSSLKEAAKGRKVGKVWQGFTRKVGGFGWLMKLQTVLRRLQRQRSL